jgi:hypothetical protein
MITQKEIIDFIETEYWKSNLQSDSDIFTILKIDGDDCEELLSKYAEKYNVDMNDFLWYFHYGDEASINSIGSLIYKTPVKLVKRIPLTPKMLTEFENTKIWNIEYPEHKLPKYRYDCQLYIFINK